MYFALGFLVAALCALLIIPALNARAERLARRRAEALFPLSISELTAQKDHLRAEFAVLQRRLERRAEEAMAVKHQSMEELGRRAIQIENLAMEVGERDGLLAELRTNLTDATTRLVAAEEAATAADAAATSLRDTLAAVEDAHRRTLDELARTRGELDRTAAMLASTKTELTVLQDRVEARDSEFSDFDGRLEAALSELDAKRITISDLETRLAMQTGRIADFERSAERRKSEGDDRQTLTELRNALLAEQERAAALDRDLADARAQLAARSASGDKAAALPQSIQAENAELRRLIVEVADTIVKATEEQAAPAQERRKVRG